MIFPSRAVCVYGFLFLCLNIGSVFAQSPLQTIADGIRAVLSPETTISSVYAVSTKKGATVVKNNDTAIFILNFSNEVKGNIALQYTIISSQGHKSKPISAKCITTTTVSTVRSCTSTLPSGLYGSIALYSVSAIGSLQDKEGGTVLLKEEPPVLKNTITVVDEFPTVLGVTVTSNSTHPWFAPALSTLIFRVSFSAPVIGSLQLKYMIGNSGSEYEAECDFMKELTNTIVCKSIIQKNITQEGYLSVFVDTTEKKFLQSAFGSPIVVDVEEASTSITPHKNHLAVASRATGGIYVGSIDSPNIYLINPKGEVSLYAKTKLSGVTALTADVDGVLYVGGIDQPLYAIDSEGAQHVIVDKAVSINELTMWYAGDTKKLIVRYYNSKNILAFSISNDVIVQKIDEYTPSKGDSFSAVTVGPQFDLVGYATQERALYFFGSEKTKKVLLASTIPITRVTSIVFLDSETILIAGYGSLGGSIFSVSLKEETLGEVSIFGNVPLPAITDIIQIEQKMFAVIGTNDDGHIYAVHADGSIFDMYRPYIDVVNPEIEEVTLRTTNKNDHYARAGDTVYFSVTFTKNIIGSISLTYRIGDSKVFNAHCVPIAPNAKQKRTIECSSKIVYPIHGDGNIYITSIAPEKDSILSAVDEIGNPLPEFKTVAVDNPILVDNSPPVITRVLYVNENQEEGLKVSVSQVRRGGETITLFTDTYYSQSPNTASIGVPSKCDVIPMTSEELFESGEIFISFEDIEPAVLSQCVLFAKDESGNIKRLQGVDVGYLLQIITIKGGKSLNNQYGKKAGIDDITIRSNVVTETSKPYRPFEGSILTVGDSNEQVRLLQEFLNQRGFPTHITGLFSKETELALKKYQSIHKLSITGVLDYSTIAIIHQEIDTNKSLLYEQKRKRLKQFLSVVENVYQEIQNGILYGLPERVHTKVSATGVVEKVITETKEKLNENKQLPKENISIGEGIAELQKEEVSGVYTIFISFSQKPIAFDNSYITVTGATAPKLVGPIEENDQFIYTLTFSPNNSATDSTVTVVVSKPPLNKDKEEYFFIGGDSQISFSY
ncbi:MAG: peptidoglycan-binding protein [Alphaproteobacteria bacterium]|nr:peptidoglycan-binding protein [Alphaproteobacteria bacterium]